MPPTVSVVIPAYNAARWIEETLQSVFAQDYPDYEVIVVDDGSTDNTAEVVARFPQVRCIRKPNGGQASARNVGIRAAQGQYIAFLDADDVWRPEKLRVQMDLLQKTGLAWVHSYIYYFDGQTGKPFDVSKPLFSKWFLRTEGNIAESLMIYNRIYSPTPVVKRSVFDEVGFFDEALLLRNREDWEMWLRIAARYPVGIIRRPLAGYRVHPTSSLRREDLGRLFASELAVVEKICAHEPQLASLRNWAIAWRYLQVAMFLIAQGRVTTACTFYRRALHIRPHLLTALFWLACAIGGPALPWATRTWTKLRELRSRYYTR
jgi:glycosyltransferase involved in cell wall biosynthesis